MKRTSILGLVIMFFLGYVVHLWVIRAHCSNSNYRHTNPLLRCTPNDETSVFLGDYEEFEAQLSDWIDSRKAVGEITEASVYFRDLKAGPWFGIRERQPFISASLFKVPVMIAVLRASEDDPRILLQKVTMSGAYTGISNVEHADETIEPGQEYTVTELIEKMILYSDNASTSMLMSVLDAIDTSHHAVDTVYGDLGVLSTRSAGLLSTKSYASIFRILYNARYLSAPNSEYALSLLTRSAFRQGIHAGVPDDIEVAHKFGVHDIPGESEKQFHDCGIVYHPYRPYILCIFTRSVNTDFALRFIRDLSEKVYQKIDADIQKSLQN